MCVIEPYPNCFFMQHRQRTDGLLDARLVVWIIPWKKCFHLFMLYLHHFLTILKLRFCLSVRARKMKSATTTFARRRNCSVAGGETSWSLYIISIHRRERGNAHSKRLGTLSENAAFRCSLVLHFSFTSFIIPS